MIENKKYTAPPKISVVIPSLNSGKYLPYTLDSIAQQDYLNYEVILIDGGSTDNTAEVAGAFNHIITTYISERDDGQSDAVNKGFTYAEGDFILWQNADDIFLPGAFSKFVEVYRAHSNHEIYFGDMALLDSSGNRLWTRYYSNLDFLIANYHGLICNNQSAFIKRSVLEAHGFLDPNYHFAMDREFFLRHFRNGSRFFHFDFAVSGFRHQPHSKTESPGNVVKWAEEHRRIARQYKLFVPDSTMNLILGRLAQLDKAIRVLISHPVHFLETLKRHFLETPVRPY